jgi:hypothetical protein
VISEVLEVLGKSLQWRRYLVLRVRCPQLLSDDTQSYTYFCVFVNGAVLEVSGKSLQWRRYLILNY